MVEKDLQKIEKWLSEMPDSDILMDCTVSLNKCLSKHIYPLHKKHGSITFETNQDVLVTIVPKEKASMLFKM